MKQKDFKAAFVTRDGKRISGDFGSTKMFSVWSFSGGKISEDEIRKVYENGAMEAPLDNNNNRNNPFGNLLVVMNKSWEKHLRLAQSVKDCDFVISRAMCNTAWDSIQSYEAQPVLVKMKSFHEAMEKLSQDALENHPDRLH